MATECPRCGIVFAKYEQRTLAALPAEPSAPIPSRLEVQDPQNRLNQIGRAIILIGLIVWTWRFAQASSAAPASESILHLPNLVFHEAGHVLFSPFGQFMRVLGGSLFQFALPLALAAVFVKQHNPFGSAVCTWWAGQNLIDLAPYIADARALQLVLLGGRTGAEVQGHDWEYILATLGWMRFDRTLGLWTYRFGLLIMIGSLIWGGLCLARRQSGTDFVEPETT